ncbi:TetR/AcrR family transcriptional regulator [Polyangium mundeleinium]|uniref:TetR/AcrR family transcriptional regulator n=1 Tax=Polyangium mundeleinium TaxID=2995306 RepID=A0ABT5F1H6_9BACT|nr:TetR/AcrR family transcriptional regulator [Polyangium mundeleinium]MDC0747932.1 TetR/AcrR family transcriptional regulator [Polyangium mundeleinium]
MSETSSSDRYVEDPRRRKLMDAALTVFTRFGFRKASMDEVARAAGISRQGLYLHFATKEDLFCASVEYLLVTALASATAVLADAELPLEKRLVAAFDAWVGRFVGALGPEASDLGPAAKELVGPMVGEHEAQFVEDVAKALRASGLLAIYKPAGVTGPKLAETLYATARGLKHGSATRDEFVESMSIAVRVMCLPLREAEKTTASPYVEGGGSRPRKPRGKGR